MATRFVVVAWLAGTVIPSKDTTFELGSAVSKPCPLITTTVSGMISCGAIDVSSSGGAGSTVNSAVKVLANGLPKRSVTPGSMVSVCVAPNCSGTAGLKATTSWSPTPTTWPCRATGPPVSCRSSRMRSVPPPEIGRAHV